MLSKKQGEEAKFQLDLGEWKSRLLSRKQGDDCQIRLEKNNYTGPSVLKKIYILITNSVHAVVIIGLHGTL